MCKKMALQKWFIVLATLLIGGMLSACTASGGIGAKAITVEDLQGKWLHQLVDGTEIMTFNSDMTYHKEIKLELVSSTTDDKFELEGNTIKIHYTDFNTISEYSVTMDGDTMVWDSGEGQIVYIRQN